MRRSGPACLRVLADSEFAAGNYDTSLLEHIDRDVPETILDLAALAAAVAKYRGTERVDATEVGAGQGGGTSPWVLVDRMEKLGRRPR